jgi:hypothetical protein
VVAADDGLLAFGHALDHAGQRLGGPAGFELRQEDLTLTRGFERIKFPLAIACMVALLTVFVFGTKKQRELTNLEYRIGMTYLDPKQPKAPPLFFGMLQTVMGGWFNDPQNFTLDLGKGKTYTHKDLVAELVTLPVHKRLALITNKLEAVATQKQKESGIFEDVTIESGLAVLVRWSELLRSCESDLGRYLVTKVSLDMAPPNRRIEFTIAFRGDDFRPRRGVLQRAIEAEMAKADSPFGVPAKAGSDGKEEQLFIDSATSGVAGSYYRIVLHVKDSFAPFGPGGGQ